MQAKGYNQKDVLQADVQKAYAAGIGQMGSNIGGGGGGGIAGDLLGLGVGMAAMGQMAPQIGNMFGGMNPTAQQTTPQPTAPTGWTCPCGATNITSNFCPDCGSPKPTPQTGWTCTCGKSNITSKFCPDCGLPQPTAPTGWNCPCGATDITSNFCPNCGSKKPE